MWNLALLAVKTDYYQKSFAYTGAKAWNALPDDMKCEKSNGSFSEQISNLHVESRFTYFQDKRSLNQQNYLSNRLYAS